MIIHVVEHDGDCTTRSQPYEASYHLTPEGAQKFIDENRSNDWEYWNIVPREVKD